MIYRYVAPSLVLQEYVRDYLIADFVFHKDQIPVKAIISFYFPIQYWWIS
jgi:hypothetical protein